MTSAISIGLLIALLLPSLALARSKVTVPANVGAGPAGVMAFGPVFEDQPVHGAVKIWIGAVIDQETIRRNIDRIDPRYRRQASQVDEIRYRLHALIPDSLIISPKVANTGMVGATWRPLSLGVPIVKADGFRAGISAGALLTYAFIWSDTLQDRQGDLARFTHFLRPGVDLQAQMEVRLTQSLYVEVGWASQIYPPQEPGANPLSLDMEFIEGLPGSLQGTIWHIGQPFVMLHYRWPFTTRMPGGR